jgi:hypothetical protein
VSRANPSSTCTPSSGRRPRRRVGARRSWRGCPPFEPPPRRVPRNAVGRSSTGFVGAIPGSGGRPRLGGTPVLDETVPARCPRNWPWSRFHPRDAAHSQDRCEWDMNCIHAVYELHPCGLCPDSADHGDHFTPGLALISPRRSGCHPAQKRNHKQSRRRAAAAGSSQTGVPPSRGRLSAQPRGSVVNQRCHLPA